MERETPGASMGQLSGKYNIPVGTLHQHVMKKDKDDLLAELRGRKPALSEDARKELKSLISDYH